MAYDYHGALRLDYPTFIAGLLPPPPKPMPLHRLGKPSANAVLDATIAASNLSLKELTHSSRRTNNMLWRAAFFVVAVELVYPHVSLTQIGKMMKRDHSTVLHHRDLYRIEPWRTQSRVSRIKEFLIVEGSSNA
jgi:Bacterial dnaA protein helix-turn-helix